MNHRTLACVTAVLFTITGCQPQPTQFAAEDEAALSGIVEATARNFTAGDMETWAQHYAHDAVFQPPNAPMVVGQANILAWGQAFPPVKDLKFSDIMVSGEGNIGYGTSSYNMAFEDMPPDHGKQLVVFRRPPGGVWAIVAVSFNSDVPVQ
ncbi:MAG: nuclear transport factor 2 family protein [Gammaproteobacteria bacterium]|nr:nuclear transport factor 2 family protein [Gammaproteobacteria bacterium]